MTSSTTASRSAFGTANPHALATILEAGETRRIISATDIYDISGVKLCRDTISAGGAFASRAARPS